MLYSATANVTSGIDTITVVGLVLTPSIAQPGAQVVLNGVMYFLDEIVNTTTLKITRNYAGATASGVSLEINTISEAETEIVTLNQRTADLLEELLDFDPLDNLESISGLEGNGVIMQDATGQHSLVPKAELTAGIETDGKAQTIAERNSKYGSQPINFSVFVNNVGDGRSAVYYKLSNTLNDWSAPGYITGPTGNTGPTGVNWRGEYSAATVYAINDAVTFNGSSFRKLTTAGAGNAPSGATPPVNNTNWEVLASKGATGSISGVTTFWQDRITVDSTLAEARAGLTPGERGIFTPAGFATADLTPEEVRTLIGGAGFYEFTGLGAEHIQFPPGFPQSHGVIKGYVGSGNGYSYTWQELTGLSGNRKWMRRAESPTTWGPFAEIWHSTNLIRPTSAEITAGTSTASRIWTPTDVVSAIRARMSGTVSQSAGVPTGDIFERGSNGNGEYVRFADGTLLCSKSQVFTIGSTAALGNIFVTGEINSGGWASPFIGTPASVVWSAATDGTTNHWSISTSIATETLCPKYRIANAVSVSSKSFTSTVYGYGRWF